MLPDHAAHEPVDDLAADIDRIGKEERRKPACGRTPARWRATATAPAPRRRPEADREAESGLLITQPPPCLRRLRVTLHHLVLQHAPDFPMQRVKFLFHADFRNIARTRKPHPPVADDARARPRRHDHDAVGERDRLFEIVGDEQHRLAIGVPQFQQQIAHDLAGLGIERPERLVHQQDLGIADQHLGQTDALALAARQHMRIAIAERPEPDRGEPALRALQRVRARRALDLQPDGDVVDGGLPGKQRIGLEQVTGLPVEASQGLVENPYRSRGRFEQAGGDVQQRRFSASGRPDNGDELAMLDPEPGLFDRGVDRRVSASRNATVASSSATAAGFACSTRIPSRSGRCISACEG